MGNLLLLINNKIKVEIIRVEIRKSVHIDQYSGKKFKLPGRSYGVNTNEIAIKYRQETTGKFVE